MKSFILALILAASVTAAAIMLTGCGAPDYKMASESGGEVRYTSSEEFADELEAFLSENADRTCYTESNVPESGGESAAAEWIADRLEEKTGVRGEIAAFERDFYYDTFESQNVVFSVKAPVSANPDGKKVVIGAHYDNMYGTCMSDDGRAYYFSGTDAEGAMGNGAAVAALLVMSGYLADNADCLTVDIDIVFYGMGCIDSGGADEYYAGLGDGGRDDVLLAVTMDKLGGDNLWMYFDEQSTAHGDFILGVAEKEGYGEYVSEPPSRMADPDIERVDSLPYTPYALLNDSSVYFGSTNICTVTSGSDFTFLLSDSDGYGRSTISYTSADTLDNLARDNPSYADQMRVAAEIITDSVFHEGFAEACEAGKTEIGSYAWLTSKLAAYIAGGVLAAGVLVFAILMSKRLAKKYSGDDGSRNIKVAVFGMDYEDPQDGDVYVDVRNGGRSVPEDPFGDDPFGSDDGKNNG